MRKTNSSQPINQHFSRESSALLPPNIRAFHATFSHTPSSKPLHALAGFLGSNGASTESNTLMLRVKTIIY